MPSYGQFCPVAKAAEVFGERWTPLILRELLCGSQRFNELERGLPRISRALLAARLRTLVRAGLIERSAKPGSHAVVYALTAAGEEMRPIIDQLGAWGQRWINATVGPDDLDPGLLMWDIRRRIHFDRLPTRRVLVCFDFRGARNETFWLVLDHQEVSICVADPGFDLDLLVTADTMALHRVWIGRLSLASALHSDLIRIDGLPDLVRAFPTWLALGTFAHVPYAPAAADSARPTA